MNMIRSIGGLIHRGKWKYWEKTCNSATVSTMNLTMTGLGSNQRVHDGLENEINLNYVYKDPVRTAQ